MNQAANMAEQMNLALVLQDRERAYRAAHARLCALAMQMSESPSQNMVSEALDTMMDYKIARTNYALARLSVEEPPKV